MMIKNRQAIKSAIFVVTAAACSAVLFLFSYHADNKYTRQGPQPRSGYLALSEQDLSDHRVLHLVSGWELYHGRLLSPEDFMPPRSSSAPVMPDEYVFIGQYGGFENHGPASGAAPGSPHGSATYRLVVELPPEPENYMLELPEIYSAYRLYINGELIARMGEPGPAGYRAETGNARAGFRGSGRAEIIFAVSDFSHFYSGIVYPPAFGYSGNVEWMLSARFAIRVTAVALALGVGAFYLIVWVLLRKSKDKSGGSFLPLLYASLCACFCVYIGYPVIKTLTSGGLLWYSLESTAFPVMLLLNVMIQSRITGFPGKLSAAATSLCVFVCSVAFITPFIMGDNLTVMIAYSDMLEYFSWFCALFIIANAVYGALKNKAHSTLILLAAVVFAMSLIMDRFLPLFEPVLFGWFSEISGAVFVISIGAAMAKEVAGQFHKRLSLELWTEAAGNRIKQQEEQFRMIVDSSAKAIKARHDLRHHISAIRVLLGSGDLDELGRYLSEYSSAEEIEAGAVYCANVRINALLCYYAAKAREIGADIRFSVSLPASKGLRPDGTSAPLVPDLDLCVVIGNCLENAVAACMNVPQERRSIRMRCAAVDGSPVIIVENTFNGKPPIKLDGRYRSTKRDDWGIGLSSVAAVAEKHGGMAVFTTEGNIFRSEIAL